MFELALGLTAVVLALAYYYFKNTFNYWQNKRVKCVKPYPLIGSVGRMLTLQEHSSDFLFRAYNEFNTDKIIGYYRLHTPVLIVRDVDLIRNVLIKDFVHFTDHGIKVDESSNPLQARNLFMMEGQKWKEMRAKLTPTFTSGRMNAMFPLVLECATRLDTYLNGLANTGKDIEIKDLLARYTTDVIGSCAFGINCDSINDPNNMFREMGRQMFHSDFINSVKRAMLLLAPKVAKTLHISTSTMSAQTTNFFRALVKDVMAKRKKTGETRKDFMQLLIEIKENGELAEEYEDEEIKKENGINQNNRIKFSDDDVTAQALVFFIAGFETSSSALTFALFELARHPELQSKARRHIEEVLQRHDGQITYQALQEMNYLDWILQEALRKYPPVPMLPRVCTKNYIIPGTDVLIERNTTVMIPIHAIHNDPIYFPDPQIFNPERFVEENPANQNLLLAFGDGPRQCIGMRFARLQSKLCLISVLSKLEVRPSSKTKYPLTMDPRQFLMVSKEDIYVQVATTEE